MATERVERVRCPRCGTFHTADVEQFTHQSEVGDVRFVGWFMCPTHNEPVMVGAKQVVTA